MQVIEIKQIKNVASYAYAVGNLLIASKYTYLNQPCSHSSPACRAVAIPPHYLHYTSKAHSTQKKALN